MKNSRYLMYKILIIFFLWELVSTGDSEAFAFSQDSIAAEKAVLLAETTKCQKDYDYALQLVNNLPDYPNVNLSLNELPRIEKPEIQADESWYVIERDGYGKYLNILLNALIQRGIKRFYLKEGTYYLNSHILIDKPDVVIQGESKEGTIIVQVNEADDGLVVKADDAIVADLTLDTREYHAKSSFTQANSNNITLYNCIINGADDCFAVFFAGADNIQGEDTLRAYQSGNMVQNNRILNCIINSQYWGDGLSFSLQNNGICAGNTINGSKLAFYMCKNSFVVHNEINASKEQGIYYSIPAANNVIAYNTIKNCGASGIKVSKELEHGTDTTARGQQLQIFNNTIIGSRYFGMEIDQLQNSVIYNNVVETSGLVGIYMLRSESLIVKDNRIINPSVDAEDGIVDGWSINLVGGIFADYHIMSTIFEGNIIQNNCSYCNYAIKIQNNEFNKDNSVINNVIQGQFIQKMQLNDSILWVSIKKDLLTRLCQLG